MEQPLKGQVAVVTGASRSLGRAIALAMAEAGADLILTARSEHQLTAVADEVRSKGVRALVVAADLSRSSAVEEMVARGLEAFHRIDILVNNAGAQVDKPLLDVTDSEWRQVIGVNLDAAFYCVRAVGRHMVERRSGRIINIGSIAAGAGVSREAAYSASKGGVVALTRAVAAEWAKYDIQVNAVCPGYLSEGMPTQLVSQPEDLKALLRRVPQRRLGDPAEVASLILYLSTPGARFITGSTIYADGGYTAI